MLRKNYFACIGVFSGESLAFGEKPPNSGTSLLVVSERNSRTVATKGGHLIQLTSEEFGKSRFAAQQLTQKAAKPPEEFGVFSGESFAFGGKPPNVGGRSPETFGGEWSTNPRALYNLCTNLYNHPW